MPTKTIILSVKSRKEVLREFGETFEKLQKKEQVRPKYELSFGTIDDFREFLTKKRIELLKGIKREHPNSIYELGKIIKRDLKSVNTDLKILEKYGLISLEKTKDKRRKIAPKVNYDKIKIEIEI